jgi:hypothetical protein
VVLREPVRALAALGPFPASSVASAEALARHESLLRQIERPVTDAEVATLLGCFGPDDCYGLAWALLHLIESAPGGVPIHVEPDATANEWVRLLWERSHR